MGNRINLNGELDNTQTEIVEGGNPTTSPAANADSQINDTGNIDDLDQISQILDGSKAGAETPPPAYTPNYKYKVNNQEMEFDDKVRTLIQSKDVEEHLRDLYTKSHGIDTLKAHINDLKGKLEKTHTQVSKYQPFETYLKNKDLVSFIDEALKVAGIPENELYTQLLTKLNRNNLPPEQQEVYRQADELKTKQYEAGKRIQELQKRIYEQEDAEVNNLLQNNPDVQALDSTYGTEKLQRYVLSMQEYLQRENGKYYSPAQILLHLSNQQKQIEEQYRQKFSTNQIDNNNAGINNGNTNITAGKNITKNTNSPARNIPPVINGSSASPVQKEIASLDDF